MSQPRKPFTFATMMVLAQRRHDARQAPAREEDAVTPPSPTRCEEQARGTPEAADSLRLEVLGSRRL